VREVRTFLKANPQVVVLLVVVLVLGIGTFIAVILGLFAAGSMTTNGEPSGTLWALASALGPPALAG
jgi:hypothetical protein